MGDVQECHVESYDFKVEPSEEENCHDETELWVLPNGERHHCLLTTDVFDPDEETKKGDGKHEKEDNIPRPPSITSFTRVSVIRSCISNGFIRE